MTEQGSSPFLQGASELFLQGHSRACNGGAAANGTLSAEALLRDAAKQAFQAVEPGLMTVESRIRSRFTSEAEILPKIADYLLELGGKRIRPILALLTAQLFAGPQNHQKLSQGLIDVAAGIELIHMATLLHDDIIDESPKRRHKESAYSKFGIAPSLLAGDFLWVRAFGLCAHLGELVVSATEAACIELTEGEILEGSLSLSRSLPMSEYESIVSKKTGSLFALATTVGAYYGGANTAEIEVLADFGRKTGIAFQMIDDILDVVADEDLLGKPSGTDLKQQTPSLPNILWLESGDPEAQRFFATVPPAPADVTAALGKLRTSSHIEKSREIAAGYASAARDALQSMPEARIHPGAREHLLALVSYTLARCL